jgi:hypothetical protein
MSEQLFKALIKNDNDEALSEFKSAIQQKFDTAMNVRRIGLTSEIFNGENSVPVTEEVDQLDEVTQGKSYTQAQLHKKIQSGNWEATHDIKPGKHVEMRHHTGKRVMVHVKEEVKLEEGKSSTGYELYHKSFSDAMQHAYDFAKKKFGIIVDPKEIDDKVASGPRKPSKGKTNSYRLKGDKGAIQVQVYGMDSGKYELNMYKEEVKLEEAVSADEFVKGGDDNIKQSEVDMLLGKIYDDSKLTKDLISSKAYGDGESNPKKRNPYKTDTIDFHLYQLGQQVELSRR